MALPCLPGGSQRQNDVLPGASARIGQASGNQLIQRLLVQPEPRRLPDRRRVRQQTACGQLFKNGLVGAQNAARRVNVFNSDQPLAFVRTGVKPAGERRDQRTSMQRTGWRGGESPPVNSPHACRFAYCAAPRGGRCVCGPAKPVPRPLLVGKWSPHASRCAWCAAPRGGCCPCGLAKPVSRPWLAWSVCGQFHRPLACRLNPSKNRQRHFQT